MENRYLFRGKRSDNGEWVYGLPSYDREGQVREIETCRDAAFYTVDPATICQCTGLKDINGKLIWENDICDRKEKYPEIVKYTSGDWTLDYSYAYKKECGYTFCNLGFYVTERKSVKVIGNVFDNQNLLEGVAMTEKDARTIVNEIATRYAENAEIEYCEALDVAIKALEDVQEYRTIGTQEECRAAVKNQTIKKVNDDKPEYTAMPFTDWSEVPVDTPILVRQTEEHAWIHRYFAKYENGTVYAWEQGATSWSVEKPAYICDWKYAKLAESEESHD